jgi:hypothetical protein
MGTCSTIAPFSCSALAPFSCSALALVMLVGCGRIGFDAVRDSPDGGNSATGPMGARCDFTSFDCLLSEQTVLAGANGDIGGPTCMGYDFGAKFIFQSAGTAYVSTDASFDTVLHVLAGADCSAPQTRCIDNRGGTGENFTLDGSDGQTITIVIDGGCGDVNLHWEM